MRPPFPLLAACFGLALTAAPSYAQDGPPNLDVSQTCNSPGRAQVNVSDQDSKDGCFRAERAAHEELKNRWKEFSPAAKKQCTQQAAAGGYPSYVETVTCLELASGTVPAQTGNGSSARPSPPPATSHTEGTTAASEASPRARTDPMKVLDQKP